MFACRWRSSLFCIRAPLVRPTTSNRQYYNINNDEQWRATTILSIRRNNKIIMIGDGQVSRGSCIVKPNARKVRKLDKGRVLTGFAGSTADAVTILERLEAKLEEFPGQLRRACVAVAQDWRTNRAYQKLEAVMIVADHRETYLLSGTGDVLEPPEHGILAVGSGGDFAASAAIALLETDWDAERIARKAMTIAADLCVYTNHNFIIELLDTNAENTLPKETSETQPKTTEEEEEKPQLKQNE
uniref:ATP-dependent protease subunit HslV n=1 Tax=Vannella robusta TaxID=1487602 RepID=A0A7S4IJZ6_9EUKA|mmetsp:Transcript_369/g.479  ORF Transcript_369/g.479 Transcript_369/m.479 type:complete len:243 (+) Transcript_369:2-730(+)